MKLNERSDAVTMFSLCCALADQDFDMIAQKSLRQLAFVGILLEEQVEWIGAKGFRWGVHVH